ncbi:MAG: nucleoside kinase [Clostridia bacterium]|nr:nucleoside kinase [Clostridia bacterium]
MDNIINQLELINEKARISPQSFISDCEEKYEKIIDGIVEKITSKEGREIVMLAGPSSAGKTTTAIKIKEKLEQQGVKAYVLSLDDFYLNREDIPYLADGSQDYETVYALDLECLEKGLNALLRGEKVVLPVFDFTIGKRSTTQFNEIELGKDDVVIIEGLHALNPVITEKIEGELLKIYINVSSRIYDKDGNIVLNKRNLRFIRRMVRDYKFRDSTVENTCRLWKNVTKGEDKYLFPYRDNADIKANTILIYEPCVLKHQALKMMNDSVISDEYKEYVRNLINALEKFNDIEEHVVPKTSLLREFLGN